MAWTPDDLPDLNGKTFVITGGNSGLGLESAILLAKKGGRVVITSRTADKADAALATIREAVPDADVSRVLLDLADLDSVAEAAVAIRETAPKIAAFINNAGVMQTPLLRTKQGFELQIGTNHFGHFKLNSLLMDVFEASATRIVAVSSVAHKNGTIDLDDLNYEERAYSPMDSYCQSKLANLMYGLELERRLRERDSAACAMPAHPGYAATNLQSAGVGMDGGSAFFRWFYKLTNAVMAQTATEGAYAQVMAAAGSMAVGGVYYGPTGFYQASGPVGACYIAPAAKDEAVSAALWERTEALVGPFFAA